ncbi:MAG: pentapeptide repeat-containing protein [Bacteroidota bacterium]|nr:pentapeptide repeat-containing protein [Bacteroidota bacterium]MDP4230070.1 pentapeptide repeat-containing protein [Bacteroidota bacterium]MDP4235745.1 pentapeptide repeat-containing protein [Bacteroidota bacterium]
MREYFENRSFENVDFTLSQPAIADYEQCRFLRCNFTEVLLRELSFIECTFTGCNLSNAKVESASFRDARFLGCKLTGVDFSTSNPSMIALDFEDCIMDYVSFARLHLKKTEFRNCSLIRAFFDDADLTASKFTGCNLENAVFGKTNLEKADFSTAYNYIIDPENNRIRKAQFSSSGIAGLLVKYDIVIQ